MWKQYRMLLAMTLRVKSAVAALFSESSECTMAFGAGKANATILSAPKAMLWPYSTTTAYRPVI
jgi:hypothetical protein